MNSGDVPPYADSEIVMRPTPTNLADRIEAYLDDHPSNGGHSDAAGASAWELLQEAMDELRP